MKTLLKSLISLLVVVTLVLVAGMLAAGSEAGCRYSIESHNGGGVENISGSTCFFQSLSVSLSKPDGISTSGNSQDLWEEVAGGEEGLVPSLNKHGVRRAHQGLLKYTATFYPDHAGNSVKGSRRIGRVVKCAGPPMRLQRVEFDIMKTSISIILFLYYLCDTP